MNYIIYKLHCMEYTYVGKTKDIKERKRKHKNAFFNKNHQSYNLKVYRTIRDNYTWDVVYFEIIEDGLTKKEATVMEDVYIRKLDPQISLNTKNGICTKEDLIIYRKKYKIKNKEKINKRALEKIHCPLCQSLHIRANMLRHQRSIKCKKIQKKNQINNHKNAEKI